MPEKAVRNHPIISFAVVASVTYFLSGADVLETFTPRSVCMLWNEKLISLHWFGNSVTFVTSLFMGVALFMLYKHLKNKGIPFAHYILRVGAFIFFGGITHFFGVLNLYVTYYWLDGAVVLLKGWFSLLLCYAIVKDYNKIKSLKTPREFQELKIQVEKVLKAIGVPE